MNRPVVAILIDWRTLVLSLALVGAFLLSFCIDPAEARVEDNPTVAARSHMADKAESALLVGATCVGDVVLVSGNHGLILRSADGGKTYQQIEAPTRRMLTAIILDAQGTAFAVGHDTTVLRSRDSGLSWQSVYCDPEADLGLFSIQAIGDSRVVAVGAFGTLLISDVVRIKMAVQAKRWKGNIQSPTVQQVRGSLGAHEQGLIITTSDFSSGAIKEANQPDKTPVGLMNGEQLVTLLMEYSIGVRRMSHDLFELEELPIAEKENDIENKGLK